MGHSKRAISSWSGDPGRNFKVSIEKFRFSSFLLFTNFLSIYIERNHSVRELLGRKKEPEDRESDFRTCAAFCRGKTHPGLRFRRNFDPRRYERIFVASNFRSSLSVTRNSNFFAVSSVDESTNGSEFRTDWVARFTLSTDAPLPTVGKLKFKF